MVWFVKAWCLWAVNKRGKKRTKKSRLNRNKSKKRRQRGGSNLEANLSNDNFYYALGAIKNVGYEAVANIVIEREKNGNFKSISDFVNRINPKNIITKSFFI